MTPEEVLRAANVAWNERGIDGFLEHTSPDVVWHAQPDYMEGQEWHGRDAISHAWKKQFDTVFEHGRTDFEGYEAGPDGHLSAVRVHARARGSGMDLDWRTYFVVSIDGDRITEVWGFDHEPEARAQAGLGP
jgi:ketosteroid isomerase-like protein